MEYNIISDKDLSENKYIDRLPGDSKSSCMAHCRVNRGLALDLLGSLEPLDLDILQVLVLAVVPDPDESFLELDRFESWEVFLVTSHDDALRFGSRRRKGMPQ